MAAASLGFAACTDLSETPPSAVSPSAFFQNDEQVLSALAGMYSGLHDVQQQYFNLSQVSSDETVVPTRGSDWYDNGKWLDIYQHTYGPNTSGSTDGDLGSGAYGALLTDVARVNSVLASLDGANTTNKATAIAEARFLRAFYYYMLQDLFGGVPIVTNTVVAARPRNTRAEVYAFIEKELTEVRPTLPAQWDDANYGRITKGAVDALLTNLYLNSVVFTGTATANGITAGTAQFKKAADAADLVLNSGQYALSPTYQKNFAPDNGSNYKSNPGGKPENIFVVRSAAANGLGLYLLFRATHYNSFSGGGWNGFSTLAETYAQFDPADSRSSILLVGPQMSLDEGKPVKDRNGNPLIFVPEIKDVNAAAENEGVRVVKFTLDKNKVGNDNGNDLTIFRLADVMLMKAEALNELGQTAAAVLLINQVRARDFSPAKPLTGAYTTATLRQQLLKERLFETMGEGKRRQDLIRFGVEGITPNPFIAPRAFKPLSPAYKVLFPIPTPQIQSNPLLTQNPGY
jgi:starch-binding outer membrane protein, SusD/RagB family